MNLFLFEKEISTLDKRVSDLKQVAKKNAITALDPPGKIVETEVLVMILKTLITD